MTDRTDPTQTGGPPTAPREAVPQEGLFQERPAAERSFPVVPVAIAAVAVLLLLVGLLLASQRHGTASGAPDTLRPTAAYASELRFTDLAMSESTSFSGGKSTFLDGKVTNAGSATVEGLTVQVLFTPDGGGAPQLETVPVTLVRTRQPYLDTEPVSAAPIAPGASADFRLIFEGIRPEWNQQTPEIRVVGVETR